MEKTKHTYLRGLFSHRNVSLLSVFPNIYHCKTKISTPSRRPPELTGPVLWPRRAKSAWHFVLKSPRRLKVSSAMS